MQITGLLVTLLGAMVPAVFAQSASASAPGGYVTSTTSVTSAPPGYKTSASSIPSVSTIPSSYFSSSSSGTVSPPSYPTTTASTITSSSSVVTTAPAPYTSWSGNSTMTRPWGTSVCSTGSGLTTSTTGWTSTASAPVPTGYTNAAPGAVAGGDRIVGWLLAAAGGMAALVSE